MPAPNFELITELQTCTRRDLPVAVPSILQPLDPAALVDGEWLELDAAYKLARGAAGGTVHEGIGPAFPVHTERGRYDTQAIGKTNVILLGMFEAETRIVESAGLTIGAALSVADVNIFGYALRRGLVGEGATAGRMIVGYVSRIPGGGKVRFLHFGYQKR